MTNERKIEILYDHYKDSFLQIKDYLKQREKLFIFVLIIIFLQFLEISVAEKSIAALNAYIENQINYNFDFNHQFLNILLWFLLFSISLRYFQTNVLINRQYSHLHCLEDKLCQLSEEKDFICREGKNYLKNYPIFSNWTHFVYTWLFPILLISVALTRIIIEFNWSLNGLISGLFFIATCITTIFYLREIHKKKKK